MKNVKYLFISLAAVIIMAAGVLLLVFFPAEEGNIPGDPSSSGAGNGGVSSETPSDISQAGERISGFPLQKENIKNVTIRKAGAPPMTMTPADSGFEFSDDSDPLKYNKVLLGQTASFSYSLDNVELLLENASSEELDAFGLLKPVLTWRIDENDGTYHEFDLGILNFSQDFYYFRFSGERDVYLLPIMAGDALLREEEAYFNLDIFPLRMDADGSRIPLSDSMEKLRLTKKDGSFIEVRRRSVEEFSDAPLGLSEFELLSPYKANANDQNIGSLLCDKIFSIAPESIVVFDGDLQAYGLDNPVKIEIEDSSGEDTFILVGDKDIDTGKYYVMLNNSRAVLLAAGDFSFLETDPVQLRSSLVWLEDIALVSDITYNLEGKTRVLGISFTEDDEIETTLDGKEIDSSNGKLLYQHTLNISIDGYEAFDISTAPDYIITMNMKDGTNREMKLYKQKERRYSIELDGVNEGFYANIKSIQALLSAFDTIDSGGMLS